MPAKRRVRRSPRIANPVSKRIALNEHIVALQREMNRLKRARAVVNRNEFKEVVRSLQQLQRNTNDIVKHTDELRTQFARIAQMQVEIDTITRTLKRANLLE
jgi:prefoldin subunit 5